MRRGRDITGHLDYFSTAGGLLSIVGFATLDRRPDPLTQESEPAAMFHKVENELGWEILGSE
jgi:hypothetical protein